MIEQNKTDLQQAADQFNEVMAQFGIAVLKLGAAVIKAANDFILKYIAAVVKALPNVLEYYEETHLKIYLTPNERRLLHHRKKRVRKKWFAVAFKRMGTRRNAFTPLS